MHSDESFYNRGMTTVKTLQQVPNKLEECLKLIENSFNYESPYSFKDDFELLIHESNWSNCFLLEADGEVICTVFTLPRLLLYKDATLPVLFIGGISVHHSYRGQGHFKSLLETILLTQNSYGLFLLWPDLSSMYEKFNFFEFGLIEEITPTKANKLRPLDEKEFRNLAPLYEKLKEKYIIPERSKEDWNLLWLSTSIDKMSDDNNSAYFLNKGMDLQNIIHESYPLLKTNNTPYSLWNFNSELNNTHDSRYTGFMRLGNLSHLSHFIDTISDGRLVISHEITEQGMVEVVFDGETYFLGIKDFIQGLWGPGAIKEWSSFIPSLIIFGFDSI